MKASGSTRPELRATHILTEYSCQFIQEYKRKKKKSRLTHVWLLSNIPS